jgi:hypothetical protein
MMLSYTKDCKCRYCKLIAAVEVTGDDETIKREFERIERNQTAIINLVDALEGLEYLKATQAKTPSVVADGV